LATAHYGSTGRSEFDAYYPARSKPIIDEIDRVMARYYGFTEKELEFLINHDIKYRMSPAGNDEENE